MIKSGRLENLAEIRWEPLYDTLTLSGNLTAGFTNMFFSVPVGQNGKTKADTNMTNAGQLPHPQAHQIYGIRIESQLADAGQVHFYKKLLETTRIRLFIGVKDYLEVPLSVVAGKMTLQVYGAKDDGSAPIYFAQYGEGSADGFKFAAGQSLRIAAGENFGVEMISTVVHNLTAAVKIRCFLDGQRAVEVR